MKVVELFYSDEIKEQVKRLYCQSPTITASQVKNVLKDETLIPFLILEIETNTLLLNEKQGKKVTVRFYDKRTGKSVI